MAEWKIPPWAYYGNKVEFSKYTGNVPEMWVGEVTHVTNGIVIFRDPIIDGVQKHGTLGAAITSISNVKELKEEDN